LAPSATTTTLTAPVAAPVTTLFNLTLNPGGMMGGGGSRGTVTLTLPAPAGGTTVVLSNSNTAANVPDSVVVPQGRDTAEFPITTQVVSNDRRGTITASIAGATLAAPVEVWTADLPNYFSFSVDPPTALANGGFRRFVPPFPLDATCSFNSIQFQSLNTSLTPSPELWSLYFQAPSLPTAQPLTPGTYDVPSFSPGATRFMLSGRVSCSGPGRFVIKELELTSTGGAVRRFWATFESSCGSPTFTVRGDVRVTNFVSPLFGPSIRSCGR
jgi:hypothetical protein